MKSAKLSALIAASCLVCASTIARAEILYNENISGDAGVDPTSVVLGSLAPGNHQVIGGNPQFDTDDYSFAIGSGYELDAIVVDNYTATGAAGIQTPFLGSSILDSGSVGKNLLALAGIPQPVNAGNYLFRTTTGTGGPTTYQYSFQVSSVPAPATIRYSETASGDAGVNDSAANLGSLSAGSNRIIGDSAQFDTDDYSFTIPAGLQLNSIVIETYSGLGSAGIQTPFLGAALLNSASVGQDLLSLAAASVPIGPGTYLFRATTGTGGPTTYRFDFQVSAVPEPASCVLLVAGICATTIFRRPKCETTNFL